MCSSFKPKPGLIITLVVINIGISVLTSALMFILTYPGDECLLFASVRGHALIYGNPVGCNYVSYGHCFLIALAIFLLGYISCSKKGEDQLPHSDQMRRERFPKMSSSFVIGFSLFIFLFSLLISAVSLAGYLTSCNELHYEAKNQLYARLTLGNPYRFLGISCNSLFSEKDFHNRFHHDHYEYSGLFYGQNRGYEHGRVHKMVKDHYHLLPLEIALEGSLAASFFSWFIWLVISVFMFLSRKKAPPFDPMSHIYANHGEDLTQITHISPDEVYHQQQMYHHHPSTTMSHHGSEQPSVFTTYVPQYANQNLPDEWFQQQSLLMNRGGHMGPMMVPQGQPEQHQEQVHMTPSSLRNPTPLSRVSSQQSEIVDNLNLFNHAGFKCSQL